jgi:hypothetical protein
VNKPFYDCRIEVETLKEAGIFAIPIENKAQKP